MQLKIGNTYKAKNGETVKIIAKDYYFQGRIVTGERRGRTWNYEDDGGWVGDSTSEWTLILEPSFKDPGYDSPFLTYAIIKESAKTAGITVEEEFERLAWEQFILYDRSGIAQQIRRREEIEQGPTLSGIACLVYIKDLEGDDKRYKEEWHKRAVGFLKARYPKPPGFHDTLTKIVLNHCSTYDSSKIAEWAGRRLGIKTVESNGKHYISKYSLKCECCGFTKHSHKSAYLYSPDGADKTWCGDCINDFAMTDTYVSRYFDKRTVEPLEIDGYTINPSWHTLYNWKDGTRHLNEEFSSNLDDYHGNSRPWDGQKSKKMLFGCELEIDSDDRLKTARMAKKLGLLAERDGSLDSRTGIEIIGPPMEFSEYKKDNAWKTFISKSQKCRGWDAGEEYGLHVSLNRAAMTHLHVGKILVFINNNQKLCEFIAGRSENEYTCYRKKLITGHRHKSYDEKYEALAIRPDGRLECRIFRSTLKYTSFLRAVEFCAAAVEFTKQAGARQLDEENFRKWMMKPANQKTYKNLYKKLLPAKEAIAA